jgi:hypothetical protein
MSASIIATPRHASSAQAPNTKSDLTKGAVRELVTCELDAALKRRELNRARKSKQLPLDREALIHVIVEGIERELWRAAKPQIEQSESGKEKIRQLVVIADGLKTAIESASAEPLMLGVKPSDIMDPKTGEATRRHSAEIDLLLVCMRAVDGLRKWNRIYRPSEGTPRQSVAFFRAIKDYCRRQSGFGAREFDDFMAGLHSSELWSKAGLPKISTATLERRKTRDKKKKPKPVL